MGEQLRRHSGHHIGPRRPVHLLHVGAVPREDDSTTSAQAVFSTPLVSLG
jgi:hypothetical protein